METEYIDLVNKIIAAEHTAQEIAREAQEKQQSLDADLERDIAHMREDYFARAKHRIEAVEKAERKARPPRFPPPVRRYLFFMVLLYHEIIRKILRQF